MVKIVNNQVFSDAGKYIHRIGSESYFKRCTALLNDTIDNYEEVEELPKYTTFEYKDQIQKLIREKYSIEEEFEILRKAMFALLTPSTIADNDTMNNYVEEFNKYCLFIKQCEVKSKEILNNRTNV